MPKVWTEGGFTFVIFLNDHEPAHVHVFLGRARNVGSTLRILLQSPQVIPDRIPSSWTEREIRRALVIAKDHYDTFLEAWSRHNR